MNNASNTQTLLTLLKTHFPNQPIRGELGTEKGVTANVETINTKQLCLLTQVCEKLALTVNLKRSGTGISIKFN